LRMLFSCRDMMGSRVKDMPGFEPNLDCLLGRAPVAMDLATVLRELEDKCVMVTGAGGSIGSELCRQILRLRPRKLLAVDRDETATFYLQRELCSMACEAELVCCVGDVGDVDLMRRILPRHKVDHVFHTAAYKHVSVMEENAAEAMRNNVFALKNLLDVAEEEGCKSFVHISSDKAVNPASIMGASKRIGELIVSARPTNGMRCVSVRFGNVLGSNGSVVEIFEEQLRSGQPLTVTHPEIRRFFMTIPEAATLVLQALMIGKGGETLVFDMGAPIKIRISLAPSFVFTENQKIPSRFVSRVCDRVRSSRKSCSTHTKKYFRRALTGLRGSAVLLAIGFACVGS
jgi:FlaA1/EpsC-like NDP-sugar epimerase